MGRAEDIVGQREAEAFAARAEATASKERDARKAFAALQDDAAAMARRLLKRIEELGYPDGEMITIDEPYKGLWGATKYRSARFAGFEIAWWRPRPSSTTARRIFYLLSDGRIHLYDEAPGLGPHVRSAWFVEEMHLHWSEAGIREYLPRIAAGLEETLQKYKAPVE